MYRPLKNYQEYYSQTVEAERRDFAYKTESNLTSTSSSSLSDSLYIATVYFISMAQKTSIANLISCSRSRAVTPVIRATAWRTYATHSDRVPPSGSSSGSGSNSNSKSGLGQNATTDSTAELLRRLEAESRRQGGSTGFGGRESVGPFPLGVGPSGRRKMWRPWKELGVRGKCECG
jgi:hypothetical protein